jgi:hypothetical protein
MPSQYTLSPTLRAFYANDPIGRARFLERARRQAQKLKKDEAVAPILDLNDGYFVHPRQPAPPRDEPTPTQLALDLDTKAK